MFHFSHCSLAFVLYSILFVCYCWQSSDFLVVGAFYFSESLYYIAASDHICDEGEDLFRLFHVDYLGWIRVAILVRVFFSLNYCYVCSNLFMINSCFLEPMRYISPSCLRRPTLLIWREKIFLTNREETGSHCISTRSVFFFYMRWRDGLGDVFTFTLSSFHLNNSAVEQH